MRARVLDSEADRLAALDSYGPVESLGNAALDALARVAAQACDAPIALVSLVDATRQCFVANVGLTGVAHTGRDVAFCEHAILGDDLMVVEDAALDERFATNPLVRGAPGIRFYAGMPLVDAAGHALGTLCVIDRVPRRMSAAHAAMLRDLAAAATAQLVAQRTARQLAVVSAEATTASARLKLILEATPTMFGYWNRDLTNEFANQAYQRIFGFSGSVSGMHIREIVGDAAFAENRALLAEALAGTQTTFERERIGPDGRNHIAVGVYTPDVREGVVRGVVVTLTDVTEARMVTRDAERRNALLALAEVVAGVGHYRLDIDADKLEWSPQVYRIYGRDDSFEPRVETSVQAYHPEERERVRAITARAIERGESFELESRIVRPDGEVRHVHLKGVCDLDPKTGRVRAVFGVVQDITEREQLKHRLARQEKLVTAGTLAAGVGHEINNPLAAVSTQLEIALEEVTEIGGSSPSGRIRELATALQEARVGVERIRKIVRGLRSFARLDTVTALTDLHAAIETAIDMSTHELRRATIERRFGAVPLVLSDDGQLAQVFVNLLVNAAQAFSSDAPDHNLIVIETRTAEAGAAVVEIRDNGPGIPADITSRIFDPFFTTRPPGGGPGLGLSIVHGIVTSLGGEVTLVPGARGATFRVVLPAGAAKVSPSPPPLPTSGAKQRGHILIVDDEAILLRGLARLISIDHQVTALGDSREALALVLAEGDSFDLVFTDLLMPYVSGIELYRAAARARPALADRFVFMTGDVVREEVRAFLAEVPNERLEKPFNVQNARGIANRFVASRQRG